MATWKVDASHSSVGFSVRHMMVTNVRGQFNSFDGTVTTEDNDFTTAKVTLDIDPNSIDTNSEARDEHLRSADFFKVNEHPKMHFESTSVVKKGDDYQVTGNFTVLGVTKPVTLNAEIAGPAKNPWGQTVVGVVGTGSIDRRDFGLTWNTALEAGGFLVGDTVKLNVELEFVLEA